MAIVTSLGSFIKDLRDRSQLTQQQFAHRTGVGLRFIRDLEQGKTTMRMDKVNHVLGCWGYSLIPGKEVDPYCIFWNHFQRPVKVTVKCQHVLHGMITGGFWDAYGLAGWDFISNDKVPEFLQTDRGELATAIRNRDIAEIENV